MIIGLIGAGHIGTAIARNAIRTGHQVVLSNSRGPETLTDLVADLGDSARAGTAQEAAEQGEIVVVTVPFGRENEVPAAPLVGKVVIDTDNYYWERDGHVEALDHGTTTVAEILQDLLPGAKVVKAFNQIQAEVLAAGGDGTSQAIPVAGDDAEAKATVTALVESFGFPVVDAGPLAEGYRFDRDQPAYGFVGTTDALTAKLAEAKANAFAA